MEQTAIMGPVFAMMLLTFVVWVTMYVRRIGFIRRNALDPQDPDLTARISVPGVVGPSDNFKNLFEIPVLFYALALYLYSGNLVDTTYVAAAWIFVAFRVLHSAVHCTVNIVMLRFYLYLFASLAVWFTAARAALHHLGA